MASSAGIVCALRYGEDRDVIDGLRLLEWWVLTFVIITVYFISHFLITGFGISCLLIVGMCRDCDGCLSFLSRAFPPVHAGVWAFRFRFHFHLALLFLR